MSTPTTVKFQIAVPSNVNGEATEKVYTLTLSLLVEGGEGEIKVTPMLTTESDILEATTESDIPETVLPAGDAPLPKDPPVH